MKSCFLGFCAIVMAAVCVGEPVYAQGEPEGAICDLCVCVFDATCTEEGNCAGETGCASTTFTPNCSGIYKMEVDLSCTDCLHCLACAQLKTAGQLVLTLQAGCTENQCSAGDYVNLTGGTEYKLYACKRACSQVDCSTCSACDAQARVFRVIDNCTSPCNW
jgi:hypothetical protein